ncbi:hypothetical protein EV702DRAFT_1247393 [Suillus placidus]|uniref:Uncharacterized protein n=1 Tax=Suillus placidus TaxID=48579 RepID=A0A9P6ZF25_9AGAM|nr:hypothetical protein EV702DRAFT_1247393 [Suillus placidus]
MPPKKSAKVAKLPKKKAKAGAILSGISRAAACDVDVGSMVNVIGGPSASLSVSNFLADPDIIAAASPVLPDQPVAHNLSSPPVAVGTFCHFCCDHTHSSGKHECVNCGAIICEQSVPRSSGCIFLQSVEGPENEFRCPMCSRLGDGKDKPLQYAFIGFGRRKKVKMAWPMAIINLNLESMKDDFLARTVTLEAENQYRSFEKNLFTSTLHMRGGAHVSESKKLAPGVEFINRNTKAGFPPNTFLVVDTHSDEYTGMLQHTGGHTGGTSTTITEILVAYLGQECLQAMQASSNLARSDKTVVKTINGNTPWCELTPGVRGGWRGVLMVSCGPAIRVSHHFEAVKALVEHNIVDFVIGFGGSGTLPSMVAGAVRSFIMEIGVFGRTDIWPAVCDMLASSNDFLDYTTAVVVFAQTVDAQRVVECRQIGKDIMGVRAFGYEFKSCPTPGCQPAPADMRVYNNGTKVRLRCLKCQWRSGSIRTDADNKHFKRVNKMLAPHLFWHHFPPSIDLQNFFVEVTAGDDAQPHQGKGTKGADKKGKSKRQADLAMDIQEDSEMEVYRPDELTMVLDD